MFECIPNPQLNDSKSSNHPDMGPNRRIWHHALHCDHQLFWSLPLAEDISVLLDDAGEIRELPHAEVNKLSGLRS